MNPQLYQRMVITTMMTDKHLDLVEQLSEESILSEAKNVSLNQLKIQVKEKCETLFT